MIDGRRFSLTANYLLILLAVGSSSYPEAATPGRVGSAPQGITAGSNLGDALNSAINERQAIEFYRLERRHTELIHSAPGYPPPDFIAVAAAAMPEDSPAALPAAKSNAEGSVKSSSQAVLPASGASKPPTRDPEKTPEARSILQMVEGYETELKIGLVIAAFAFVLGWVCGVSYYERRERKWRHKLRF